MKDRNIGLSKSTKLSWGLFYRYGFRYIYKYFTDFWYYIKRVFFTLKHTYPPQAKWEAYQWMTDYWREVLEYYRYNRNGDAYIIYDFPDRPQTQDENEKVINEILDHMIELLDKMDDSNVFFDAEEFNNKTQAREDAKNEFFDLLKKYFYYLWD